MSEECGCENLLHLGPPPEEPTMNERKSFGASYIGPSFTGKLDPETGDMSGVRSDGVAYSISGSKRGGPCEVTTEPVPVGRELDALVAERVMGCKPAWIEEKGVYWCPCSWKHAHLCGDGLKPYSEDIGAAWGVVERLRASKKCGAFELYHGEVWEAVFNGELVGVAQAATAPEAICRAALAWAARKP